MAVYFGRDDTVYATVTAADVTDPTQTAIMVSGSESGPIVLSEARKLVVMPLLDTPPSITDPVGLYSVQTTANRGLYYNTGTEIIALPSFSIDGTWPV